MTLSSRKFVFFLVFLSLFAAILIRSASAPASADGEAAYRFYPPDRSWVNRTIKEMSLRDKVAQLIQIRVPGRFLNRRSPQFLEIADQVRRNHIGGVILFAGEVYESARLLNELQQMSELPLFVAADFERGASFRIAGTTSFPWTMAIGATGSEDFAFREGVITAREARALGVHWIFAPVVDVNNNPDNPVINIRSYGEDPELVSRLSAAFIRGARENGVLTTAKHFPGHGDTATDSHLGLAVVPSDMSRLNEVELVPFRSAVEAGVDAVMTAHVAVPQVTGEADVPATLSPKILTGLLRDQMHFEGLVVTDAMEMAGVTSHYWTGLAAIRAFQAGADLLLLPPDTDVAINEVVRAVSRGDIAEERIDRSVRKILALKTQLRLHKSRTVPLERIEQIVAAPEDQELAQEMADRSVTLVKDERKLIPVSPLNPPGIFSLVVSSDLDSSPASVFQSAMRRRFPDIRTESIDPRTPEDLASRIVRTAREADIVVLATLVRVTSGKGDLALPRNQRELIGKLIDSGKPVIWVAFGNPYVLRSFPNVSTYVCTYSYADVSQVAAARALSGEIAVTGRSPVSIPGYCKVGDGLQVPRLDMTLKPLSPDAAGLPPRSFEETVKLLESYAEDGAFPGASLVVGYRGSLVLDAAAGRLDYSDSSPKVTGDTIYDLASLSKVVGTTSAAMMLAESGRLLLDAPVQDYLPEFEGEGKEKVRIENLLRHSAGLPAWLPLYLEARGYEDFMKRVYALPLEYEPGSRTLYSDFSMILLGEIVARTAGMPLDEFLARKLFEPLKMNSTFYRPSKDVIDRIAPTENDPWRNRIVHGEVHDENAYAMGGVSGHAGLFSTAHDLAVFVQMLLNKGVYDHRRYLKAETIERFTSSQGSGDSGQALGWKKPSGSNWTGSVFSRSAYGHTGFTGTMIWVDPQRQAFLVLLTNRVYPSRENQKIEGARREISESVMHALGK